ncbi:acyl-CoA dehydrogenase family protein [Castellaniella sp.]|uniref:acyl-CoA dehydrogenase family protein n=1 Tax=Castellaniella sp. TaxID=1955812 RepID=UPI003563A631
MTDATLVEGARAFVKKTVQSRARAIDETGEFPSGYWEELAGCGLTALVVPGDQAGLGVDRSTFAAIIETVGGACASTAWALLTHSTAAAGIAALGTDAQKAQYLPALATGQAKGAFAATETGGGSNPGSISTRARALDDGFVLDGGKFFISQAGAADVYLVLARTADDPGPQGLSCFILEKSDRGLSFGRREDTMGLRGVQVREMFIEDCHVPAGRLLGGVGGAQGVLAAAGGVTLVGSGAAALGVAQAAFDATLPHVRERHVLGKPLAALPGVQTQLAQVFLDLEAARSAVARGLSWLDDSAKGPPLVLWLSKVAAVRAAQRVADACLAAHGAIGYSRALPLERHVRDLRAFGIHWGNNEVLMDTIGKMLVA